MQWGQKCLEPSPGTGDLGTVLLHSDPEGTELGTDRVTLLLLCSASGCPPPRPQPDFSGSHRAGASSDVMDAF